jgi:hypothetical protein
MANQLLPPPKTELAGVDLDADRVLRWDWDPEIYRSARTRWGHAFMAAIDRALIRNGVKDDR